MPNPSIDRATYTNDSRFEKLREQGISYETFKNNETYYLQQLSSTSIHDLYNKGKAMYEKYTNLYNQSNNLFIQLLKDVNIPVQAIDWAHPNMRDGNLVKYNELLQNYAKQANGDESKITSTQKSSAARESGYTVDLIRSTNNAESMASIYLDGRRNAVSMQRMGLAQSVFEDIT